MLSLLTRDMGQMKAIQPEPEVSSVNEQDFTSERPLLSIVLLSTFCGIFFVVVLAIVYSVEGLGSNIIFIGLVLIMLFLYFFIPLLSMYRLRVNYAMDELVIDSIFLGCRWRRKRKKLSDLLYLRYRKTVSKDENNNTQTHYEYIIHGNSGKKRDWKLNISNMMRDPNHPNKMAKEIAKSIGITFKSR